MTTNPGGYIGEALDAAKEAKRVKRKPSTSPTQRALADLKEMGLRPTVVERWNPYARVRQDLWGFVDILCLDVGGRRVIGVQATSGSGGNHSARVKKIRESPLFPYVLACGVAIEVWSYAKRGKRGEVKRWKRRRTVILKDVTYELDEEN